MCGIAGYYGKGDGDILKKMADTVRHRGPDDAGYYVDESVGLAHRRLSIIDLSPAGHQPMTGEDESVHIVFNGEIYNFQELQKGLKQKHTFKGGSDTEVIVHCYEEIGVEVFAKLRGMFAIALYDKKQKKLFLARDGMGKKPLYYGIFGETLLFGSELKALMAHSAFKGELDISSLNKYFQYEYVPTPHTMFQGVFKLEPGHYAAYDGKSLSKTKFWDVTFSETPKGQTPSLSQALKHFDTLLYDGVKKRLVSDVPLGVFLSGGIDSSTVAYYAQKIARDTGAKPIQTFSIGFTEDSFDESKYARQVARFLGTEHHEKILSAKEGATLIPEIFALLDEPMADASIIPTHLLSRFTREHVTVALGGDGGDELLCGYDTFLAHRVAGVYEKVPSLLRKTLIERLVPLLPSSHKNMSWDFKMKKFISGFYGSKRYRNQRWLGAFDKDERKKLFSKKIGKEIDTLNEFEDIDNYLKNISSKEYYDELTYLYLRTYMMDDILVKVDRASMFNSLEVRAPFLDIDIVDFLVNLPLCMKLRGFTGKYLLKKLMEDKLPYDIVYRKKKGFGIPLAEWLSGELKPLVLEMLSEERLKEQGLFDPAYVAKLLDDHFAKRVDNRKPIWTLLVFQMWYNRWYRTATS